MRTSIYILAAVAVAGFATAGAQNTGNPATPSRAQTPARQPTTPPRPETPMPSPQTSATPAQPTQQTVRPPDSQRDRARDRDRDRDERRLNPANEQQRVPPASRGVGENGKPDCSKLRGLEKSECERRDTTRDDLPAGVTPKQAEK